MLCLISNLATSRRRSILGFRLLLGVLQRFQAVQIQRGQEYVARVVLFNGGKRRGENLGERAAFLPDGLTRCAKINQHGGLVFSDKDVFGLDVAVQQLADRECI